MHGPKLLAVLAWGALEGVHTSARRGFLHGGGSHVLNRSSLIRCVALPSLPSLLDDAVVELGQLLVLS